MQKNKTNIVFMGTPDFSIPVLEGLLELENFQVSGVVTQPDKKAGRGGEIKQSPVKILAKKYNLPVLQPEKITDEAIAEIKSFNPDVIVVAAYGHIIPKKLLDLPKYKCINVHGSLLPKYRGASPIQWAILEGEKETGITIMLMDEKMDHGAILEQAKIQIDEEETSASLFVKMSSLSKQVIKDVLPLFVEGKLKPRVQDELKASFTKILSKDDGHIFWSQTAEEIERKVRALDPWPSCFSFYGSPMARLKILQASIRSFSNKENLPLGQVVLTDDKKIGVIASKDLLVLEILQLEGKKKMASHDFLNGYPEIIGTILK